MLTKITRCVIFLAITPFALCAFLAIILSIAAEDVIRGLRSIWK